MPPCRVGVNSRANSLDGIRAQQGDGEMHGHGASKDFGPLRLERNIAVGRLDGDCEMKHEFPLLDLGEKQKVSGRIGEQARS